MPHRGVLPPEIPRTMSAVVATGGSLTDRAVDTPVPGPRDLLVQVEAVSVNPVDLKRMPPAGAADRVLGFDAAGTVVAVGAEVAGFAPGAQVYYAGDLTRPGADAQFHAVDERVVGHKPTTLSFAEAAAMPLTTLTAGEGLWDHLGATAQTTGTLLVVGAAGGVGSVLVQLARQLTGLRVIGTASREESAAWVRRMGAHEVVDHRELGPAVRELAPDGVDAVFSAYSAGRLELFADLLRPFGHIVAIDGTDRDVGPLKSKALIWHWEYMFARTTHGAPDMARQGEILDEVAGHLDAGTLQATGTRFIDDFSARGLRRAFELVGSGRTIGKVVVHR